MIVQSVLALLGVAVVIIGTLVLIVGAIETFLAIQRIDRNTSCKRGKK